MSVGAAKDISLHTGTQPANDDQGVDDVLSSIKSTIQKNLDSGLKSVRAQGDTTTPAPHDKATLASDTKTVIDLSHKESVDAPQVTNGQTAEVFYLTQLIEPDGSITLLKPSRPQPPASPEQDQSKRDESCQKGESVMTKEAENARDEDPVVLDQEVTAADDITNSDNESHDLAEQADVVSDPMETGAPMTNESNADSLASSETLAESAAAFSSLSDMARQIHAAGPQPQQAHGVTPQDAGAYTVEGLMREMLRPLLKEWLDAHLPSLVKWLVQEQIEKMLQDQLGFVPGKQNPGTNSSATTSVPTDDMMANAPAAEQPVDQAPSEGDVAIDGSADANADDSGAADATDDFDPEAIAAAAAAESEAKQA